ncbi:JAB domain-containing protein [Pedobacter jeongneungensis]
MLADPKIIFSVALKTNSGKIILWHNHPSGSIRLNETDIKLTTRLVE